MSIRTKLLLVFAGGLLPLLALAFVCYQAGARAVEGALGEDTEQDAEQLARRLEIALGDAEADLAELARSVGARPYASAPASAAGQSPAVPEGADNDIRAFLNEHRGLCTSIAWVDRAGGPVRRFEPDRLAGGTPAPTRDLLPGELRLDPRLWTGRKTRPLRSPVRPDPSGNASLVYAAPVRAPVSSTETSAGPRGALVAELRLDGLFQPFEYAHPEARGAGQRTYFVLALDEEGRIVYHTNHALKYQPVGQAMPRFEGVARAMRSGAAGVQEFKAQEEGRRWLVAYRPVKDLNVAVAVGRDATGALAPLRRTAGVALTAAAACALAAAGLLAWLVTRTTRRVARVTAAANRIAAGELEQRVQTRASDETRSLAESFNRMSDRLRELIAREAEAQQFQSFFRLSAMLTHDLKNSITGLSFLVSNMERMYHREEFRADAISSLRDATEKLRALVARLSKPAQTLSGEYVHTLRPADLSELLRRTLDATVGPSAALYEIDIQLPGELIVPLDAESMSRVAENLLVNAMEAMGTRGGRLTVAAGREDGHVFFSVADTGVGMSKEFIRDRLFRAFATTKKSGIGLGLYTCREIVEAHGGRLEVESRVGAGTRFRVVLPSAPITAPRVKPPAGGAASKKLFEKSSRLEPT